MAGSALGRHRERGARPRPLFVTGTKRSGTTLVTNLLNLHPRISVTYETDIVWLLYQARHGAPSRYRSHPSDSSRLMAGTLLLYRRILEEGLSKEPTRAELAEAFYRVQARWIDLQRSRRARLYRAARLLLNKPTPARLRKVIRKLREPRPPQEAELRWMGDKKHAQHLDPDVRAFLARLFPDARYIHIVRHPKAVVASTMRAARSWLVKPPYFDQTAEEILRQWAVQEEMALRAEEGGDGAVMTVRLEELCVRPLETMSDVFGFLDLESTDEASGSIPNFVYPDPNAKYESFALPDLSRARRIMEAYGYEPTAQGWSAAPADREAARALVGGGAS